MMIVNEESKATLKELWGLAKCNSDYYKLDDDSTFMPLTIEIIEESVISLCHYGEQYGDLMRYPEMLFYKDSNNDFIPYYYRNDYAGIEELTGEVYGSKFSMVNEHRQFQQARFADAWLLNIKYQQLEK